MRFLTLPVALDDPRGARFLMGQTYAESRNGTRITTTLYPEHLGRVLAARLTYLATLDESPTRSIA